jgi:hypothetical protein
MPLGLGWELIRRDERERRKRFETLRKVLSRTGKKRGPMGVVDLGLVPFLDAL